MCQFEIAERGGVTTRWQSGGSRTEPSGRGCWFGQPFLVCGLVLALVFAARGQTSPYANAVLADNPLAYWKLNETGKTSSGTLVAEDSAHNFNGVYGSASTVGVPGPTPSSGFPGFESDNTAVEFTNGLPNSYVTVPALNLNANTVTITAWVYPVGIPASYSGIVFCRNGGDASGFCFTDNGQLGYTWNQNNSDTWSWMSGLVPPPGQWSFIALVVTPTNAITYLCNASGFVSATNPIAHNAEAFSSSTLIGNDNADGGNGGRTFNGVMDEVAIFNSSLTSNQLSNFYYNAAGGPPRPSEPTASPSNTVYAGTSVTFTEAAAGQAPLLYQWRTDGGSGGARTNISEATNANLTVNTSPLRAGEYNYDVVVSNSYGASTSAVATLDVLAGSLPVLVSGATPAAPEVDVGNQQEFSATFKGTLPISYQWQANTGGGMANLPNATNAALILTNLQVADSGSYRVLAINLVGGPVSSSVATLTVVPLPPFPSAVMADNPLGYWRLNETASTAGGNLTAVDMTGNYEGVYESAATDGVPGPDPAVGFGGFETFNTAVQFTNGLANSFVTIPELNLNTNTVTLSAWIYPIGTAASYSGLIFCRPGSDASGLNFTTGGNLGYTWNQNNSDTYSWISGLVPPLQQWSFVALVISPDNAIIYLCNTNSIQSATNSVPSTAEAFNTTTLIGDDADDGGNGARTFNGIMDEVAIFNSSLNQNQVLNLYFNGLAAPPQAAIPTASPSTHLFNGDSVVLSELALGATPFEYQWESNGLILPGSTNSALVLSNLGLSASGNYQVIVGNNYGAATSAPLALSVTFDTNPPVVLRAFNIGTTNVEVDFSKTVAVTNATNAANYGFTDGLAITAASLATNNASVLLATAPLVYNRNYTLVLNGLRDRALPPNAIASNTLVSFTASPFAPLDIGSPAIASTDTYTTNGETISSAGNYVGGTSDQFNFDYQLQSGNFDVNSLPGRAGIVGPLGRGRLDGPRQSGCRQPIRGLPGHARYRRRFLRRPHNHQRPGRHGGKFSC